MSLTTTFEPHRTNQCFEGLQEPRRCPTKLVRAVRQDDRHISHCKGSSYQSSACGCSPAGTGAILLVVWPRSSSAHRTDRLVRDRDAPVLSAAHLRDTTLRSSVVSALPPPQHPIARAISFCEGRPDIPVFAPGLRRCGGQRDGLKRVTGAARRRTTKGAVQSGKLWWLFEFYCTLGEAHVPCRGVLLRLPSRILSRLCGALLQLCHGA
jgi:hypothetical protein